MSPTRLVIFTRFPEPGLAKTRLIPALGEVGAAMLHRRLTERTLAAARASGLALEVRTTGASTPAFEDWLGEGVLLVDQGGGDLGERLQRAASPTPVLFIGSDLPDITADHLTNAVARLLTHRVVVGPAEDGGYWALGLTEPCDYLFDAMPWGTDRVLDITLNRLREHGIKPALLPTLADCDRPEDLARWSDLH
jgi:rSAM/selenodomain-associated transferase 1